MRAESVKMILVAGAVLAKLLIYAYLSTLAAICPNGIVDSPFNG